jgi:hypothetical protein
MKDGDKDMTMQETERESDERAKEVKARKARRKKVPMAASNTPWKIPPHASTIHPMHATKFFPPKKNNDKRVRI